MMCLIRHWRALRLPPATKKHKTHKRFCLAPDTKKVNCHGFRLWALKTPQNCATDLRTKIIWWWMVSVTEDLSTEGNMLSLTCAEFAPWDIFLHLIILPLQSQHISPLTLHQNFYDMKILLRSFLSLLQSVGVWLSGSIYILFRPKILSAKALGSIFKDFLFNCYLILDYILKKCLMLAVGIWH